MNTELAVHNYESLQEAGVDLHQYARVGDQQALERCLSACLQPVYRQAYTQLGNDADAQDVVQESLLQLVRSAQRYDPQRALAPWLARHVSDACMRFMRSAVRRKRWEGLAMSEMPTAHTPSVSAEMDCEHELVRLALEQLKEKDRAIISLHYFAGLSQADTGKALGISENAASVRLHRARSRMKKILENQGVGVSISGGAVAALALLPTMAQAAPLAPATLLPQVIATCTAATLPSTLISLSLYNKGIIFMSTHTVFTSVSIMMLSVAMCAGAVLWAADKEAPAQNPIVVKDDGPSWNPAAAKLLAFYDEQSVFAMAADADAVRALLLNTRPFKQLLGGDDNILLKNWQEEILRYQAWVEPTNDISLMMKVLPVMRGAFAQSYARFGDQSTSLMTAMDAGNQSPAFMSQLLSALRRRVSPARAQVGDYDIYSGGKGGSNEYIVHNNTIMESNIPSEEYRRELYARLKKNSGAAAGVNMPANRKLQKNPLWMTANIRPFLDLYLPLSAETQSPIEAIFGVDWKDLHPRIDLSLSEQAGNLRVQGTLRDLPVVGFALTGLLMMNYNVVPSLLQLRAPQGLPAADATALAEIRLGCDIEKRTALRDALAEQLSRFGVSRLINSWNGELLMRVHAGVPMPQPTIVFGLHKNTNALKQDMQKAFKNFGAQKQAAVEGYTDVWTVLTPVGMLTCALAEDRLVVSAGKVEGLLEKTVDDVGLSIDIDLPQIASYASLVWGMIPQQLDFLGSDGRVMIEREFIKKLDGESGADTRNEYFMPATVLNNVLPAQLRKNWLGVDESIDSYISVWRTPTQDLGRQSGLRIIYRSQNAYCLMTGRFLPIRGMKLGPDGPDLLNLKEVKKMLEGAQHIAGASLQELQFHSREAIPVLDRQRHIPSLPDIIAALPRYRLRWQQDKNGAQHFEETGLPLVGLGLCAIGFAVTEIDPTVEDRANNILRIKAQAFVTHKKRLADLQRIVDSMKGKNWKRPSEILQIAPADALSSVGLGKKPSARQLDQLGYWYGRSGMYHAYVTTAVDPLAARGKRRSHGHIYWVIPLEKGLWAYITREDVGIKTSAPERPVTKIDDLPQQDVIENGANKIDF